MTAQEELKHLMEQHTLNMRDVARIVCRETLKPVSMRAVRGWLASPEKGYSRPCPHSVVEAVKTHFQREVV